MIGKSILHYRIIEKLGEGGMFQNYPRIVDEWIVIQNPDEQCDIGRCFMIGKTILHYKIIEKLGEGGMGVVYLAEDTKLERKVAIKFLPTHISANSDERKRFEIEAKAAAALNHPNIATIHAIEEADDQIFLVMEYIEGKELKQLAIDNHQLAIDYAVQIAEGLQAAHKKGIVHRDIKSSNIMVTEDGKIKIMDFGLAKFRGAAQLTQVGTTVGTAAFMSPEQARGEEVDQRSDIWSFGVILYEMLSTTLPFKGDYEQAIIYSILNEPHTPINNLSAIDLIINKCLEKEKEKRYKDMATVVAELNKLKSARNSAELMAADKKVKIPLWIAIIVITTLSFYLIWDKVFKADNSQEQLSSRQINLKQITFADALEEYPSFSPDANSIVFCREINNFRHIFYKDLLSASEVQITAGNFDNIQPVLSMDGNSVLFVRSNAEYIRLEPGDVYSSFSGGDIWKYDLKTKKENKLLENAFNPSFSPDGNQIAFDASWAGTTRIWAADQYGRNAYQLSFSSSEAVEHINPHWSPDGSKIVYQEIEHTKFNITVLDLTTKESINITDDLYENINPVWSGSGDFIYFSSYKSGGRNIWRLAVSDDGRPLNNAQQVTSGAGEDVQLSIAANKLAFTTLKINADLWKLPVSPITGRPTAEPQQVIATTREDSRGAWSMDGSMIAFNSDRSGDMNLWIYSNDNYTSSQITEGPGGDYQPKWSPDNKKLVFFSSRSGNPDIWLADIETKQISQLTKNEALDINPFLFT